jgi:hypothetical protein
VKFPTKSYPPLFLPPEIAALHELPPHPHPTSHIPLTYTGGDCSMTWKSKHATEPPCPRIRPRPHPVRRQKRQPNNGKSVSPSPKPNFFARGLWRVETRRSNDPQPNSALSFLRAAVEDQSRITLTTKHPITAQIYPIAVQPNPSER